MGSHGIEEYKYLNADVSLKVLSVHCFDIISKILKNKNVEI